MKPCVYNAQELIILHVSHCFKTGQEGRRKGQGRDTGREKEGIQEGTRKGYRKGQGRDTGRDKEGRRKGFRKGYRKGQGRKAGRGNEGIRKKVRRHIL
jgi:hypothetical protein